MYVRHDFGRGLRRDTQHYVRSGKRKTDIVVANGDSGGPFFWNNTALGTTISVVEDEDETPVGSVYGPVDQFKNILELDLIFN